MIEIEQQDSIARARWESRLPYIYLLQRCMLYTADNQLNFLVQIVQNQTNMHCINNSDSLNNMKLLLSTSSIDSPNEIHQDLPGKPNTISTCVSYVETSSDV